MHVEIQYRHPGEPRGQRNPGANGNVVEKTETHRGVALGMVTGRTYGAKGIGHFTPKHRTHRRGHRTGGTHGGLEGVRIHRRVRINLRQPLGRG